MNDYVLSCGSTADLTKEHFKKLGVEVISFHFTLGDKEYIDDFGKTISYENFYDTMATGVNTKTSQPNVHEYLEYFRKFLSEGKDVLHIELSSGLSGAFNSANLAKEILVEEFLDRKLVIVDSLAASGGYGLLMSKLSEEKAKGLTFDELNDYVEENKLRLNHWFYTTDLKYFVRGGRISKVSGYVGNLLSINPILNVDDKGKLIPRIKVIGNRRVIIKLLEVMEQQVDDGLLYDGDVFITHANVPAQAEEIKTLILAKFIRVKNVNISYIGTTIGAHTGPGTVSIFFFGKSRAQETSK